MEMRSSIIKEKYSTSSMYKNNEYCGEIIIKVCGDFRSRGHNVSLENYETY